MESGVKTGQSIGQKETKLQMNYIGWHWQVLLIIFGKQGTKEYFKERREMLIQLVDLWSRTFNAEGRTRRS